MTKGMGIHVHLSEEQNAWLLAQAAQNGMSLSDFIRTAVLGTSGFRGSTKPMTPRPGTGPKRDVGPPTRQLCDRREEMIRLRVEGRTLQAIGDRFGLTRERVRQITLGAISIETVRRKLDREIDRRIGPEAKSAKSLAHWWAHVKRVDDAETCWIWSGATVGGGYGHFNCPRLFGKVSSAHRQSFYLANGYFPKRPMNVLHRCGNPTCVRPDHLYEGTMKQNTADAIAARGGKRWPNGHEGIRPNKDRDQLIVRLSASGKSARELADQFGLSEGRVYDIVKASR